MFAPKPFIQKLKPATHGGRQYAELQILGIDPAAVVDFSVSTNPLGPPPGLKTALIEADLESYPDSDSNLLKNRLAASFGVAAENLVIGNGSTELIRLAAAAYLGVGDKALILQPTYAEYALSAQLVGAEVCVLPLTAKTNFSLNPAELVKAVKSHRPRAIFICNPNNPSGEYLGPETVQMIVELASDSLIVLDEAYISFVEKPWSSVKLIGYPNLIVVRSMTKDYAMAGIRLGYAMACPELIANLQKVKPPWNVNSLAQAAGCYALDHSDYLQSMRTDVADAGRYLKTNLERIGLKPLPSRTNFFLVKVGDAAGLRTGLLRKGLLIRDCSSFGLPQYMRLAVRSRPHCQRLISALEELGVKNYER